MQLFLFTVKVMIKNHFEGMFPLFVEFNMSLYQLFNHAPGYIGKLFVGAFYGIIFGFLLAFWRKEIFHNTLIVFSSLWILTFINCITIEWKQIFFLLGISGKRITLAEVWTFLSLYYVECSIALLVSILIYKTVEKYT
jgi:hypothetical protein